MGNLIIGFVLGVSACTVGFSTMAQKADQGVRFLQGAVREASKAANAPKQVPVNDRAPTSEGF